MSCLFGLRKAEGDGSGAGMQMVVGDECGGSVAMDPWSGPAEVARVRGAERDLLGGVLCGVVDLTLEEEDVRLGRCGVQE